MSVENEAWLVEKAEIIRYCVSGTLWQKDEKTF